MTIDEAIKHCEEVAEEQDKLCKRYDDASGYSRSHNEAIRTTDAKRCEECAAEYRQLAEWLRELKDIKHLFSITEKLFKANFRGGLIDVVDGYDILFSEHKQLREIFEEGNADIEADKGVLEKINEKQNSLRATCKAWDEAISRDGYVN